MGKRVYLLDGSDFADLARRIELHYRQRAESAGQPWATSFMHDDPRGKSIYDQFKGTWMELCRWADEQGVSLHKEMHG